MLELDFNHPFSPIAIDDHPHVSQLAPPPRIKQIFDPIGGALELVKFVFLRRSFNRYSDMVNGEHIIVIPGFSCSDLVTLIIRRTLQRAGYQPHGWGLGVNRGNIDHTIPIVIKRIEKLVAQNNGPITAIGWSLGGLMAREIARQRPELLKHVITTGTPVVGGPKYTAIHQMYTLLGYDLDQVEIDMLNLYKTPITTPISAYYTKKDGVVSWQACIDPYSPNIRHTEVSTTHFGMGCSPELLHHVLGELQALTRQAE